MPRIFEYHSADRATSFTLITRWSSASTLTGMAYPFVASEGRADCIGSVAPSLLQRRPSLIEHHRKIWSTCNDFSSHRVGPDRHRSLVLGGGPRPRCGLSGATRAVPGRLSPWRRDRH